MLRSSLGSALLHDSETWDLDLVLYDGHCRIAVPVHRVVLQVSAPYFRERLNGSYAHYYVWGVPSVAVALTVLRFFYSREVSELEENLPAARDLLRQLGCVELPPLPPRPPRRRRAAATAPLRLMTTRAQDRQLRRRSRGGQ